MTGQPSDVYETEVRIQAQTETVFQFFIDPAKVVQWMAVDAAMDPRPGGLYRANVTGRETVVGEFIEVVPHSRIVLSWGWDSGPVTPGSTRVEIDFIPDGEATLVRLRHIGLDPEGLASHREGWEHYLARLDLAASGRDPGLDPWARPPTVGT